MTAPSTIDVGRLGIMLNELRLPSMKAVWADFAARADKEGWPAARFLGTLAEHELAERDLRRIERQVVEARLPPGKTLDSFDFDAVPMISKAQVSAVAAGDAWLKTGATNNGSERALRPCAVYRKITHGFRSEWGAVLYADIRSVVETGRRRSIRAIDAICLTLNADTLPQPKPA